MPDKKDNLCRIPVKATMRRNPATGKMEMVSAHYADVPADMIAGLLYGCFKGRR